MLKKVSSLILLLMAKNVAAVASIPVSTSIDSWLFLMFLGLGLPILALFLDKKNKR